MPFYPDTTPREDVTPVGSPVIIDNGDADYSDADDFVSAGIGYEGDIVLFDAEKQNVPRMSP